MTTMTARGKKPSSPARRAHAEAHICAPLEPTSTLVRCRAYEIFLARNGGPGDHLSDWLQAERELREESGSLAAGVRPGDRDGVRMAAGGGPRPIRAGILDNPD